MTKELVRMVARLLVTMSALAGFLVWASAPVLWNVRRRRADRG